MTITQTLRWTMVYTVQVSLSLTTGILMMLAISHLP